MPRAKLKSEIQSCIQGVYSLVGEADMNQIPRKMYHYKHSAIKHSTISAIKESHN